MADRMGTFVRRFRPGVRTFQVYGRVCGLPTVAWWRGTVSRTASGFSWHITEH